MKKQHKNFLVLAMLLISSMSLLAQDVKNDIQVIQGAWGKEKREIIKEGMNLTTANAEKFWPIYDAYEEERKALSAERLMIINDYGKNYTALTDEKADELMKRVFSNNSSLEKLEKKYYDKMKKALSATEAAKFFQIENYLKVMVSAELQDEIPFIAELDRKKKSQ